ncbi:MAG: glycosyltransferase family 4 protein, partial [Gemmatimonadetes bacterium]|nr:glycosyltransferase family 4 protein [Gemmatimonadota bacterium]
SNASFARLTTGRRVLQQMEDIFRSEGCELVHVHDVAPTLGIAGTLAASRLGVPVVATLHSWFERSRLYQLFRRPYQAGLDRLAATIVVSELGRRAFAQYFRTDDWEVIPNGVDTQHFHPNGRTHRPRAGGDASELLFLGRLDPRNGLDTLLAAMPGILGRYPRATLTVAGDGPLRNQYLRLAAPLGDRVRFVGSIWEERPRYYAAADIFLVPIRRASWSVTMLEAMACGVPTIAADIEGFRQQVAAPGEALLVPVTDAAAWTSAVIELLGDPARRSGMAAAARARAEQYAWPTIAGRVERVYQRVLE